MRAESKIRLAGLAVSVLSIGGGLVDTVRGSQEHNSAVSRVDQIAETQGVHQPEPKELYNAQTVVADHSEELLGPAQGSRSEEVTKALTTLAQKEKYDRIYDAANVPSHSLLRDVAPLAVALVSFVAAYKAADFMEWRRNRKPIKAPTAAASTI